MAYSIRGTIRVLTFSALACVLSISTANAASINGLHNTGVDGSGAVLSPGSVEANWVILGGSAGVVATDAGAASAGDAAWIGAVSMNAGSGKRWTNYMLAFNVPEGGADLALKLDFASGGRSNVYLNGIDTGFGRDDNGYTPLSGRLELGSLVLGATNFLVISVRNSDVPNSGGLLVSDVGAHMPEPTAALLFGLGFTAVGMARKRRA